jgi:adenylate cyclase
MLRKNPIINKKIFEDGRERLLAMLDNLKPGLEEVLGSEMLKSERKRTIILSIIANAIAVWLVIVPHIFKDFFPGIVEQVVHGYNFFTLMAIAFVVFGIYEIAFSLLLRFYIIRNKTFPVPPRYANAFVEISFISILILVMSKTSIGLDAIYMPTVFLYFILIGLSAFRLKFSLSFFTGSIAAIEYLLLYQLIIRGSAPHDGLPVLFSFGIHFARASIFFLAGTVTGLVAIQVRGSMISSLQVLEERNTIVSIFGQHVSMAVVDKLLKGNGNLESEIRNVCVMFLDIRNFTKFCEGKQPQEIVDFLNYLFKFMVEIVNHHNGIINKFLGDGFMAVFGAPVSDGSDCENAVRTAEEIYETLHEEITNRNISPIRIGIGLHAGEVVTGNIGSPLRKEYTVIGDIVNLASRIEQLNKQFGSEILMSQEVWNSINKSEYTVEDMGIVDVRGHRDGVHVYKLA